MKYSRPVWEMAEHVARGLGGNERWLPLIEIVQGVQRRFQEDVNEHTIRHQVIRHCVNRHPGHDSYPDKGKFWQERRVFVTDGNGNYRLYSEPRDLDVFKDALRQHGL